VHGRERNPGFKRQPEGDGVAIMDVLGDRVFQRAAFVRQR